MNFKKMLALFLVLAMVFSFMPTAAFAEGEEEPTVEEAASVEGAAPAEEPAPEEDLIPQEPEENLVAEAAPEEDLVPEEPEDLGEYTEVVVNKYSIDFNTNAPEYVVDEPTEVDSITDISANTTVTIGDAYDSECYGYEFVGWTTVQDDEETLIESSVLVEESDVTLYALWEAKTVSVSFEAPAPDPAFGDVTFDEPDPNPAEYDFGEVVLAPADPSTEGWNFVGWFNGTEEWEDGYRVATVDDIAFTAAWAIQQVSVTYASGLDEEVEIDLPDAYVANYGDVIEVPDDLEEEGLTFKGWLANGEAFTEDTAATGDFVIVNPDPAVEAEWLVDLTGDWEDVEFTVTFMDGIDEYATRTVLYGGSAELPADPVHEGHTFSYWSLEDGTPFTNSNITADVTVYAEYDIDVHEVAFYDTHVEEGVNPIIATAEVEFGAKIGQQLPAVPDHEEIGLINGEWRLAENEGGQLVPTETVVTAETVVNADFAAIAVYERAEYGVAFADTKDAEFVDPDFDPEETYNYGDVLAAEEFEDAFVIPRLKNVEHYDFAGWYYTAEVEGEEVELALAEFPLEVTGPVTLTAHWYGYYMVTFENEGPNGFASEDGEETVKYYIDPALDMDDIDEDYAPITDIEDAVAGGEYGVDPIFIPAFEDDDVPESDDPTLAASEDYFKGWFEGEDEFVFSPDDNMTPVLEDTTITAEWLKYKTVTFDVNAEGAAFEEDPIIKVPAGMSYNEFVEEGLPVPEYDKNTLEKWLYKGAEYDGNDAVTADITLVAQWVPTYYDVTINPDTGALFVEGKVLDSESIKDTADLFDAIPELEDGDKENCIFDEWFYATVSEEEGWVITENPVDWDAAVNEDTFIMAKWTEAEVKDDAEEVNYYKTFAEAVADAADGATLTLLKDVELADNVEINNSYFLNMADFALAGGGYTLTVGEDAEVTARYGAVSDAIIDGEWTVVMGSYEDVVFTGNVTVMNGSFSEVDFSEAAAEVQNGTFSNVVFDGAAITGGKFDEATVATITEDDFHSDTYVLKTTDTSSGYYVLVAYKTLTFVRGADMEDVSDKVAADQVTAPHDFFPDDPEKQDPERVGFRFDGWFADEERTEEFAFGNALDENTAVYAKWTKIVEVTFNYNGADNAPKDEDDHEIPLVVALDYTPGVTVAAPENVPVLEGKVFDFWGYEAAGEWVEYNFDTLLDPDANLVLTAKWQWQLTFDPKNGDDVTVINVANGAQPDTTLIPTPTMEDGSTFFGWYTEDDETAFDPRRAVDADEDYIALWNNVNWMIENYDHDAADGDAVIQTSDSLVYTGEAESPVRIFKDPGEYTGYYLGYTFAAPNGVTKENANMYSIFYDGDWHSLDTDKDEDLSETGHVAVTVYEEVPIDAVKQKADAKETFEFVYRFARTADIEDESKVTTLTVSFDPNYVLFFDFDAEFPPQLYINDYRYVFDVMFDHMDGTEIIDDETLHVDSLSDLVDYEEEFPWDLEEEGREFQYWTLDDPEEDPWSTVYSEEYPENFVEEYEIYPVLGDVTLYAYWHDVSGITLMVGDVEYPIPEAAVAGPEDGPVFWIGDSYATVRDYFYDELLDVIINEDGKLVDYESKGVVDGWVDEDGNEFKKTSSEVYNDDWTIGADGLTLYAKFATNTVSFMDGELEIDSVNVPYEKAVTDVIGFEIPEVPLDEGQYGFWTEEEPDEDGIYDAEPAEFDFNTVIVKDVVLYAYKATKTFTVSYVAEGATNVPEAQTKTYGEDLTLSDKVPEIVGKVFDGWEDEEGTLYQPGDKYTVEADAELTATWSAQTFTVTYVAEGAENVPEAQTKTYGTALKLSDTVPTIVGKVFEGWVDENGTVYQPGDEYTAEADATLTAAWEGQTFTVTYVAEGAENVPDAQTKNYGVALKLSDKVPTMEGQFFEGWVDEAGKLYQPGDEYTADANVTLTATWTGPIEAFVTRSYRLILEREPDVEGFEYWTESLKSGERVAVDIVSLFVNLEEYSGKHVSGEEFVTTMYRVMMNREPDQEGLTYWVDVFNSPCSYNGIINGFLNSPQQEFQGICAEYGIEVGSVTIEPRDESPNLTKFLARNYKYALNREPDIDGLNWWASELLSKKQTPQDTAVAFVFSEECIKRDLNNSDFVEMLYGLFMGRASDAEGKAYWVNALISGSMSRNDVVDWFAGSPEFADIVASFGL